MKKMKRLLAFLLAAALLLSGTALAAEPESEVQTAAAHLKEQGILLGNERGDLMLDSGLTRAQLAALLTRLHGEGEVDPAMYEWACYFTDVPAWARPYVGYCVAMLLMNGYNSAQFGPSDMVSPEMACTVMLRTYGYANSEGSAWNYNTACAYAAAQGLLDEAAAQGSVITRGDMAVLICRALQKEAEQTPNPQGDAVLKNPDGSITITQESWSREDFSQQANPAIFTGAYTRKLYNTFRQTIVDFGTDKSAGDRCAYTMVSVEDYSIAVNLMGRMDGVLRYEHYVPANLRNYYEYLDYFAVSAAMPENYQDAYDFVQPVLEKVNQMDSDRDKVTYLNDYLCTLLTYEEGAAPGITQTFSDNGREIEAACGTYTRAFSFLCSAAKIPCIKIHSANHGWNLVYLDSQWLHVDVTNNDCSANTHNLLLSKTSLGYIDEAPEMTSFLKELIIPGSTSVN